MLRTRLKFYSFLQCNHLIQSAYYKKRNLTYCIFEQRLDVRWCRREQLDAVLVSYHVPFIKTYTSFLFKCLSSSVACFVARIISSELSFK